MIIKIFTMQKDEDDILEDWIEYHSKIVGYENIYLIDNYSNKKSIDILDKYKNKINIYKKPDYSKKGDYIAELIKDNFCDIAIPLDLDEFIGIDNKSISNTLDISNIKNIIKELNSLPEYGRYSFLYYLTSSNTEIYYNNPIKEITKFHKINNGINNKKFFRGNSLISLDHGNHNGVVKNLNTNDVYNTKLFLYHYHFRGVNKLIQKCKNDILGLKLIKNINDISELKQAIKKNIHGAHNIETYLKFIEQGPYSLLSN
jgi:hypothetical protein